MLKPFCQATALILLCALLVYAPEIYTAVSGPFALSTPERVLLRVVLCTQDDETLSSFYSALTEYQRSHPAVHLRIVRTDSAHLYPLDAPLPDVYLLTESDFSPPQVRARAMRSCTRQMPAVRCCAPYPRNPKRGTQRWISSPISMKSRQTPLASHNFCLCNASYSGTIKAINTGRTPWTP